MIKIECTYTIAGGTGSWHALAGVVFICAKALLSSFKCPMSNIITKLDLLPAKMVGIEIHSYKWIRESISFWYLSM